LSVEISGYSGYISDPCDKAISLEMLSKEPVFDVSLALVGCVRSAGHNKVVEINTLTLM
jgi:hypothetical protein